MTDEWRTDRIGAALRGENPTVLRRLTSGFAKGRAGRRPDGCASGTPSARRPPREGWKAGALGAGAPPEDQACGAAALIAEMSKFSLTLSLTMTPPVSSAAFHVRPQSERRMSALPSKPTRSLP